MKYSLVLSFALMTLSLTSVSTEHARYKIKTDFHSPAEVAELSQWLTQHHFDVAGSNWIRGEVEVITDQGGVDYLTNQGYVISNVFSMSAWGDTPDSRYMTPETLDAKMRSFATAHPDLARLEQIGSTLQGRPIMALLISTTPDANDVRNLDKATILIDGQHHAREIMTPEVVLDVADTVLKDYSNPDMAAFLQNWNIWLVPSVNPDGTNIVFSSDNMWRKNARSGSGRMHGVDINRNYSYKWNGCRGSSSYTWAQDFRGASASSEPETQAMISFANKIRPSAYLSYHSYSELVLYPFGCANAVTSENAMFERVSKELAARLPRDDNQGNYTAGAPWQLLYPVDGDSMGFMYAAFGAFAYTFEINEDFQPSYSLRDPTVAKQRNAWMYFMNTINRNLLKVLVVDAKTGQPAQAGIEIDAIRHTQGESPFQTNQGGRFNKVLDAGHYTVSAKLADGRAAQAAVDMNGQSKSLVLTIN